MRVGRKGPQNTGSPFAAFSDLAHSLAKTLKKGDEIRAEFETWNDKEGSQRTGLTVIASKVENIKAEAVSIFAARPGGKSLAEYQLTADTRVAERVAARHEVQREMAAQSRTISK
jgi:predicted metal-dependent RNase